MYEIEFEDEKACDQMRDRLRSSVSVSVGHTGCWDWQGRIYKDRLIMHVEGTRLSPRRMALAVKLGRLDADTRVYAACGNTKCVNPGHMQPV